MKGTEDWQERVDHALTMIDLFVAAGSRRFDVTQTTIAGEKWQYSPGRNIHAMKLILPAVLPVTWEGRRNLIIRPCKPAVGVHAQLDDLDGTKLQRVASTAFLVVETSPGSYQAWLEIWNGDDDFVRRLVRGMEVDLVASRAVRIAGSMNCKPKYAPDFPVVRLAAGDAGLSVSVEQLEDMRVVAPAREQGSRAATPRDPSRDPSGWPDYQQNLRGAPLKQDGTPHRHQADFMFAKWALERGHDPQAVAERLLAVSEKAREEWDNGNQQYALRTVQAAMKAV